ncbi:glycoside hydrolase family protein, partial [Loigolactobacillus iwatensis]|uniref:glycoside hydrolase family protein n=1 Tax=Loigolactobacillus iwatensis TaxID=1267156 RepID=UPI001CDD40A1
GTTSTAAATSTANTGTTSTAAATSVANTGTTSTAAITSTVDTGYGIQSNTTQKDVNTAAETFSKDTLMTARTRSTIINGYQNNTYYQNGKLANGYLNDGKNWYLFKNGIKQSQIQKWAGYYYYFDPKTNLRVDNVFRDEWSNTYYFGNNGQAVSGLQKIDGKEYYFGDDNTYTLRKKVLFSSNAQKYYAGVDGALLTGVQKINGTYYYFDSSNYRMQVDSYDQASWGDWYMFGSDGKVVTGWKKWAGGTYYFDPATYLKVTGTQNINGKIYYFGTNGVMETGWRKVNRTSTFYTSDGSAANGYVNDGNHYYLFKNGVPQSGVQSWAGTYYYFDPKTYLRVDNAYVQSQWGDWYMFGSDGKIVTSWYTWNGATYYFDPKTYLKVTGTKVIAGVTQHFSNTGKLIGAREMNIDQAGLGIIERFEGLSLNAYRDAVGVVTIGYGHTNNAPSGGQYPVHIGDKWTQTHANDVLKADVQSVVKAVNKLLHVSVSQNAFDALISFTYNLGIGTLTGSTLLAYINKKDMADAANQFLLYVHSSGGVVLTGLVNRRNAEKKLFLS